MTYEEAIVEVEKLRAYQETGTLSTAHALEVENLYKEVLKKRIRECNCKDKYSDAVIEIYLYLKRYGKMKEECTARLKNGVVLQTVGDTNVYTNDNLTDEVAREYLKNYPTRAGIFSVLPKMEEQKTSKKSKK